jgi:hypothetical protein
MHEMYLPLSTRAMLEKSGGDKSKRRRRPEKIHQPSHIYCAFYGFLTFNSDNSRKNVEKVSGTFILP